MSQQTYQLGSYSEAVSAALKTAQAKRVVERLWQADTSVWSGRDENRWVGWLDIVARQLAQADVFERLVQDIQQAGFTDALLLGMGGSSLCPEVMRMTFGKVGSFPDLHVLDSTLPAQVERFEKSVDLSKTICIVASKSGSTTEPNVFRDYFYDRVGKQVGAGNAGKHFIAITDPGSQMEIDAKAMQFRHIFYGVPEIGGRYSALSQFGMIPAAVMGVDVPALLNRAAGMVRQCGSTVPVADNPGVRLGITLGVLAKAGRDKVTILTSPAVWDFGAWMEQLIAESTGKEGKGLIPIDSERLGVPGVYGNDRVFVYISLASSPAPDQERAVDALEAAGHPVIRLDMADPMDIGAQFFLWEIATAAAGHVLGINPFDQPNVQESKNYTKSLTDAYEQTGALPAEEPIFEGEGIKLFADAANATQLSGLVSSRGSLDAWIAAHLGRIGTGDYAAFNVYIDMNNTNQKDIQAIRHCVRDAKRVATTLGFGPRFLHSTGQLHKGGPDSGVFTQVTCDDAHDLVIPGKRFSFGTLKAAQSTGDLLALSSRKRRLLRIHLPADVTVGLERLRQAVEKATA